MKRAKLDGVELAFEEAGSGDPLLLIHGAFIADAFCRLLTEPSIAGRYRMIAYHRAGYTGSAPAPTPYTISQQAADARALLGHLGIERAHVAGHSYGGAIAMQLALDAPDAVGGLALLEPALVMLPDIASSAEFLENMTALQQLHERGEHEAAVDGFMTAVVGPDYREVLTELLPPGTFETVVADSGTTFQIEKPALEQWRFTAGDAARIRQPVLSVTGGDSAANFLEVRSLIERWMPRAEQALIPGGDHAFPMTHAPALADVLTGFLDRHPL